MGLDMRGLQTRKKLQEILLLNERHLLKKWFGFLNFMYKKNVVD